jgi:hypothetical protein
MELNERQMKVDDSRQEGSGSAPAGRRTPPQRIGRSWTEEDVMFPARCLRRHRGPAGRAGSMLIPVPRTSGGPPLIRKLLFAAEESRCESFGTPFTCSGRAGSPRPRAASRPAVSWPLVSSHREVPHWQQMATPRPSRWPSSIGSGTSTIPRPRRGSSGPSCPRPAPRRTPPSTSSS